MKGNSLLEKTGYDNNQDNWIIMNATAIGENTDKINGVKEFVDALKQDLDYLDNRCDKNEKGDKETADSVAALRARVAAIEDKLGELSKDTTDADQDSSIYALANRVKVLEGKPDTTVNVDAKIDPIKNSIAELSSSVETFLKRLETAEEQVSGRVSLPLVITVSVLMGVIEFFIFRVIL